MQAQHCLGVRALGGNVARAAEAVHPKFLELGPWRLECWELGASGGGTAPPVGTGWLGAAGTAGPVARGACTGADVSETAACSARTAPRRR